MSLDVTKVQFETVNDVDKIAYNSSGSLTAAAASPPSANVTVATIANPYGKRCLMTFSWSLDNVNFYPMNVPIFYYNSSNLEYQWQALGFGGCSDSLIYLCCTTQYGSPQTIYVQFAVDSPT
jgi:hypothetical protein